MAAEPGIYTGTAEVVKNTILLTHTLENYIPTFREEIFNSSNVLKALSIAAFGAPAVLGNVRFGNVTKTSGKGIRFWDGGYQMSGMIATTAPAGTYVDRMGNINPEYPTGTTGWAYSSCRYVVPLFVPEENVRDNQGKARLLNILETRLELGKKTAVRDVVRGFLGASTAPSGSPTGLKDLVAVTQTATIGGVSSTNSYWQNKYKAGTNVGGAGELDRPLQYLRNLQALRLGIIANGSSTNDRLYLGTQGAYQYYLRAVYADSVATGQNPSLINKAYAEAGIEHTVANGSPFIYDTDVAGPTGSTASKEYVYDLGLTTLGVGFHRDEYFKQEGWEAPRAHDKQRYYQCNLWLTWLTYVISRRDQGVLYDIPANPDAS